MSLNVTLSSGDVAAIITAVGTVVIGILQVMQKRQAVKDSLKIDENTALTKDTAALTKDTAAKVEVIHAATTAIVENTGTHQALPPT